MECLNNKQAELYLNMMVCTVKKLISSYLVLLVLVDPLVF